MNLYILTQNESQGYDTYDSVVVAAETEDSARKINPSKWGWDESSDFWCSSPEKVNVRLIGIAVDGVKEGVILSSFNAG